MVADRQHVHDHFSRVAEVYREVRTTDEAPIRFIRDELEGRAAVRSADIGCGAGRYDLLLFRCLNNLRLICVDVNAQMLAQFTRHLNAHSITDFETRQAAVEDLELPERSLDFVCTFNAVHHFAFPTFLAKAGEALTVDGRIFVYTRTPEQNAGSIWGRYFPDFPAKETRLYDRSNIERWVREAEGLRIVEIKELRFPRVASLERLLEQVANRHYSTFSLYEEAELERAVAEFEAKVRKDFDDLRKIVWEDRNIMLEITRRDV